MVTADTAHKVTDTAKEPTAKAATTAKTATARAKTAKESTAKAATTAKTATARAAKTAKESTAKAATTAKATRAARAGRVEDAREMAAEADLRDGMAATAIAEAESLHYQVEVNKRGLSASALTTTLNERWDNGWRLAHVLEQRGNTVLVFEKRS